jgi:nitrous oxidase accessory protein
MGMDMDLVAPRRVRSRRRRRIASAALLVLLAAPLGSWLTAPPAPTPVGESKAAALVAGPNSDNAAARTAAAEAASVHALPATAGAATPFSGTEHVVGPDQPLRTITEAVQRAQAGDRVRVLPGLYREGTIVIDRRLELVGEGWPELDAVGEGQLLHVTADSVVIRGFRLSNAAVSFVRDHSAILFDGVTGCVAEGNELIDNFFGIYLAKSRGCRISGNRIRASNARESSSGNGIHLWNSAEAYIADNHIAGQRDGIYLEHVSGAVLERNTSEHNLRYGLHFMFSSDNRYIGNTFRENGAGVAVMYSKNVVIEANTFADNWGPTSYGLLAKEISDSRIEKNTFVGNTVGFSSEGSMRVRIEGNRFVRNGWATRVMANSHENVFTGNDFVENSFDVTTNSRQNFNRFEGNYWSRYAGYDLDGDGVGDVPFRPVRLFSLLVERTPVALVLLRSVFVDLLDIAERVAPVLTPEALVDMRPRMQEVQP